MTLEAPFIARRAKPGQFVQIKCSNGYEPLLRRPFSIHRLVASAMTDKQSSGLWAIEILYEVIGKGTEILALKRAGEKIDVLGSLGSSFIIPPAQSSEPPAIIIGGGIGIAPLVFLAEELKKKKIKTTVLLGTKTKNLILCEKDFKKLGTEIHIATDDGSRGCKGLVSQLFRKILRVTGHGSPYHEGTGQTRVTVYACGPNPMLKCIAGICEEKKIDCQVSLEEKMACGIGACLGCVIKVKGGGYKLACKDGPVFNANQIIWECE